MVVNTFKEGRKYEGEYARGKWHGYGVETKEGNYCWAGEVHFCKKNKEIIFFSGGMDKEF